MMASELAPASGRIWGWEWLSLGFAQRRWSARGWAVLVVIVMGLGQAGCASTRYFAPAEHVTALSPSGAELAAEYTVREGAEQIAEVKLWSTGATRNAGDDDDDATVVRVGFEINNRSNAPVRLDTQRVFLEDVKLDDGSIERVRPATVDGATVVEPGREGEVSISFQLPGGSWPGDVRSYRVAWVLTNGGTYEQKTPFVFVRRREDYGHPYYWYSPYYYWGPYPGWYYGPYRHRALPGWRYRRWYPYYP